MGMLCEQLEQGQEREWRACSVQTQSSEIVSLLLKLNLQMWGCRHEDAVIQEPFTWREGKVILVILPRGEQKQEVCQCEVSLNYLVRVYLKKKNTKDLKTK